MIGLVGPHGERDDHIESGQAPVSQEQRLVVDVEDKPELQTKGCKEEAKKEEKEEEEGAPGQRCRRR